MVIINLVTESFIFLYIDNNDWLILDDHTIYPLHVISSNGWFQQERATSVHEPNIFKKKDPKQIHTMIKVMNIYVILLVNQE